MADIALKRNDVKTKIRATLKDENGSPLNLTGAAVKFLMTPQNGAAPKINAAAAITDAVQGRVEYEMQAADIDTAGAFNAEWEVTFADGSVATAPRGEGVKPYIVVQIVADLA